MCQGTSAVGREEERRGTRGTSSVETEDRGGCQHTVTWRGPHSLLRKAFFVKVRHYLTELNS